MSMREHPGIGVRELAAIEGISAPAMCGYVDRLEAAGLVTRVRSTEDRRRVGLELTDCRPLGCCAPRARAAPPGSPRA